VRRAPDHRFEEGDPAVEEAEKGDLYCLAALEENGLRGVETSVGLSGIFPLAECLAGVEFSVLPAGVPGRALADCVELVSIIAGSSFNDMTTRGERKGVASFLCWSRCDASVERFGLGGLCSRELR
jgi:hypothetical protein